MGFGRSSLWLILGTSVLGGCTTAVAGALDEPQANRVVVALDHAGIGSDKEPDPGTEGRFRVLVARDDAPRALGVLREEELPEPPMPGVLEAMGKGSLVPSQLAERAQWTAALGGELERTLIGIDGVLGARVHLSLPTEDPLAEGPRPKATASVLIKHRGATPPIDASAVRRLVAGAAPSLSADDVAVVLVPRPTTPASADRSLARLGPIWATRSSITFLRVGLAVAIAVCAGLTGFVLALWSRLRKKEGLLGAEENEEPPLRRSA